MEALLRLELRLRPGVEPVEGWLAVEEGPAVRFSGYLELLAAVERAAVGPGAESRAAGEGS